MNDLFDEIRRLIAENRKLYDELDLARTVVWWASKYRDSGFRDVSYHDRIDDALKRYDAFAEERK